MTTLEGARLRSAGGARRALGVWLVLALAAVGALVVALASGTDGVSFAELLASIGGADARSIVWQLRWPRAAAAFATGALLALSGGLMQILLRNPLADPYVLGLSGGSAVGALAAMLAGATAMIVEAGAAAGAAVSVLVVFGLARHDLGHGSMGRSADLSPRLLLTGVILAAGWGAAITLILTFSPDAKLRGMMFWLMGDLNGADGWALPAIVLALVLVLIAPRLRELNVLLRGPAVALALGVDVRSLTLLVYAVTSLATAAAVTTAGAIGFVGLIVPHALRLVVGNDQRVLLPASALAGGTLLTVADTLARTVAAPTQLPVGMVMALIGVPTFIALMHGRRR